MMWSSDEFNGIRCVVTGATGGIGREICRALHEAGAFVIALDVVSTPTGDGPWSRFIPCDVTSDEDIAKLDDQLSEEPVLDVLVNAAGIMRKYPVGETNWLEWDHVYAVNCKGALRLAQLLMTRLLKSNRGRIVNVVSMTATLALPTYAPYSSAKAALLNASKVLGAELARTGVTVNTISPGWVATPMIEPLFSHMEQLHSLSAGGGRAYIEALIPQNRLVEPSEVAAATLFLSSRAAGAITGHDLAIDGGLTTMFTPGVHSRDASRECDRF